MDLSILFAFVSMFIFGLNGGISKKVIRGLGPLKYGLYRNIALTLVLGVLTLLNIKASNFDPLYIFLAVVISIFIYFGFFLSNTSINKGRLGIVMPITSSRIVITTILASTILKESLNVWQYFLIGLIIFGIITISVNFKELKNYSFEGKGIKEAMLAAVIFGITMTFYGLIGKVLGAFLLGFIVESVILLGCFVHLLIKKENLKLSRAEINLFGYPLIGSMIFSTIGVYFSNFAYISGSASIITAILAAAPIITTLYDRFINKEIMNFQENMGMAVIFVCIIALSIF